MKKLVAIDGNSIMNRAFYGIMNSKLLMTTDGIYTNAIYGFLTILLKMINDEKPDYLCVAFDLKAPTFRHKKYEDYKGTRKGMPDELRVQMPIIKDVLRAMNITICELEGYEADDIIGTLSKKAEEEGMKTLLLTGDKDYLQLATENVTVRIPTTKMGNTESTDYTPEVIKEKYGIDPIQFIQIKGLMGDSSDNIPGVPGVGEKTAFSLITKYHDLDNIYNSLDEGKELDGIKGKLKEKLIENRELAFLSRDLGTIFKEVPLDFDIDDLEIKEYNSSELYNLFVRLQFKNFIEKLGLKADESGGSKQNCDIPELNIKDFSEINLDGVNEISYYFKNGKLAVCVNDTEYYTPNPSDEDLKKIFESDILKIGHGEKADYLALKSKGFNPKNMMFDLTIASYILNPAKDNYRLDEMILEVLGIVLESKKENVQLGLFDIPENEDKKEEYSRYALYILKCKEKYETELKEKNQFHLFENIEMPLMRVLAEMEFSGVLVDREIIDEFSKKLSSSVDNLTHEIWNMVGTEFNINSPKQLGEILFEKLQLPVIKKTKSGYSTDADVLEKLRLEHPIIDKILEYRTLNKLKATYIDGIIPLIKEDGRVHAKFNQTVTATGRISCTEPNLQNIPIRTEIGKELRKMFVAKEGFTFLDADYSQIELRVLAHISEDENMIHAFNSGEDIHAMTASQVFDVPLEDVTKQMRSEAKAVNFGIVYGISDFGLATNIGTSRKKAKEYIEKYFAKYPGIKAYMDRTVKECKEKGYVETLWGRRRYVPEIKSNNFNVRQFGERVAMNAPIQGTAADIIKIAMINIEKELEDKKLESKLLLQVHDELVIETKLEEIETVRELLVRNMENVIKLDVPLKVEAEEGKTWFDAH